MLSHETKTDVLLPVSKPGMAWASSLHFSSGELEWRACCKPPNWAVVIRRCLSDVVSTPVAWSATLRSPEFRMGPLPISKPSQEWAAPATRRPSLELVWGVLKPPNRMAVR